MPTTLALSCTSTPMPSSSCRAWVDSASPKWLSTAPAASSRTTLVVAGSKLRKLPLSVRRESSAICPAISTPVAPAPTTTKVSQASRASGSVSSSASSYAPKILPRSSRASSMVFMPGAYSAKWSLPK